MPEYVRVKDISTGHHYTVLATQAKANPDAFQILKQPAVDANGDPLPGAIPDTSGAPAGEKKKES